MDPNSRYMGGRLETLRHSVFFYGTQKDPIFHDALFFFFFLFLSQSELETKWSVVVFCITCNKTLASIKFLMHYLK